MILQTYLTAQRVSLMLKVKDVEEANRIIIETESLIRTGCELTVEQQCRYEFAKILLLEIAKRRKKQSKEDTR